MKQTIRLLRGELLSLLNIDKNFVRLEHALKAGKGDEAGRHAAAIENIFTDLNEQQLAKEQHLKAQNAADWRTLIAAWPDVPEKTVAQDLLNRISDRLTKLKKRGKVGRALLDRDVEYTNFTINVLTGASAGTTYSAAAEEPGAGRALDMFNASV